MHRTFIGWSAAMLMVFALASPVQARPKAVSRDGSAGESSTSAPSPRERTAPPATAAPAPATPSAPTIRSTAPSRPATPTSQPTVAASQRSGRAGARSGGDRQGSSGGAAVARPRTGGTSSTASAEADRGDDRDQERRATRRVRPRDDRASVGTAVARTRPRSRPVVIPSWAWSRPSYWYGYNSLGLGYFYYDPYWWGYPGYYGHRYGLSGYYGGPSGYYGGYSRHYNDYYDRGQLRLKVKPRDAEVRVDGYFVGKVDEYDGIFQRLTLETGPHRVEIQKPGFEPLVLDIRILPDETVTYEGRLEPRP